MDKNGIMFYQNMVGVLITDMQTAATEIVTFALRAQKQNGNTETHDWQERGSNTLLHYCLSLFHPLLLNEICYTGFCLIKAN